MIIIYEIDDVEKLPDNGHYLSVDLGLHNLLTCYDSEGKSFIMGRRYLSVCRKYDKEITRSLTDYCVDHEINTVIVGDIKNIRKDKDMGNKTNQKLHALPYEKIYGILEYKLAQKGICMVKQEESYTSQCSPYAEEVSAKYAQKSNRKKRGLYVAGETIFNADAVEVSWTHH